MFPFFSPWYAAYRKYRHLKRQQFGIVCMHYAGHDEHVIARWANTAPGNEKRPFITACDVEEVLRKTFRHGEAK